MDDEWDDLDGEVVDLDGCAEATGDPQLDQFGYQSPKQRGGTGFTPGNHPDYLAQAKADRVQRQRRRRMGQRRAEASAPAPAPDLAPHVAQAVAEGLAGRDLGWWKVDVDAYGRANWTKVEQPGPQGPTMTVEQTPSPGTRVW